MKRSERGKFRWKFFGSAGGGEAGRDSRWCLKCAFGVSLLCRWNRVRRRIHFTQFIWLISKERNIRHRWFSIFMRTYSRLLEKLCRDVFVSWVEDARVNICDPWRFHRIQPSPSMKFRKNDPSIHKGPRWKWHEKASSISIDIFAVMWMETNRSFFSLISQGIDSSTSIKLIAIPTDRIFF